MIRSSQSASSECSGKRHPFLGALFLSIVALAGYFVVMSWRETIISKRLDTAGVRVNAVVVSAEVHSGSGHRSTTTADITYAFEFAGHHFVDTDRGLSYWPIASAITSHQVPVTLLPSDPESHRIEPGHSSHTWENATAATLLALPFFLIFGLLGVGCYYQSAEKGIPAPPPAEFFVRLEPFFELPTPRPIRWRWSNLAWTAFFTLLILGPPAYAANQWRIYLAHRAPYESFWPWDSSTVASCLSEGIAYFAVALPLYLVRLGRMRRCARLARFGRTTIGIVDWKLRVAWDTAKRKNAAIRINGVTIGALPGKDDWVTYRYAVDGQAHTGESADGRALLWRSHAIPPAVYLPTGRQITVVYDPQNPSDSLLLPYLRYYIDLDFR